MCTSWCWGQYHSLLFPPWPNWRHRRSAGHGSSRGLTYGCSKTWESWKLISRCHCRNLHGSSLKENEGDLHTDKLLSEVTYELNSRVRCIAVYIFWGSFFSTPLRFAWAETQVLQIESSLSFDFHYRCILKIFNTNMSTATCMRPWAISCSL